MAKLRVSVQPRVKMAKLRVTVQPRVRMVVLRLTMVPAHVKLPPRATRVRTRTTTVQPPRVLLAAATLRARRAASPRIATFLSASRPIPTPGQPS
jgi:hypothetical protein